MATPAPYLVEEILEEILIRLPTPAALIRASTACASFRRIITARPFMRRYRKLHPPPLLGFAAKDGGFHPAEAPHPSAPLARALADAADFSYSYVPKPGDGVFTPWSPCDVRDGRVLLLCIRWFRRTSMTIYTKVLAVCDPLSRRYVLLPPFPVHTTEPFEHLLGFEPVLAPIGDDEDTTPFRVLCWASYASKFFMFVFSSATGKWCIAASPSWSSIGAVETSEKLWEMFRFRYIRGCLCWTARCGDKLLAWDTCRMEFSTVNILTSYHMQLINLSGQRRWESSVVLATEGALEMFTLIQDCSLNESYHIYHTTQRNVDHSSDKCELKNVIALPPPYCYSTVGATGGFLFFRASRETPCHGSRAWIEDIFSLDVKSSELKMVRGGAQISCKSAIRVHPYFGFPPSLSEPSL